MNNNSLPAWFLIMLCSMPFRTLARYSREKTLFISNQFRLLSRPLQSTTSSGRCPVNFKCFLAATNTDESYLLQAAKFAEKGLGHTFPNPAVGCVLVNQSTGEIIGSGFHPRAGFPHAEIFALFEAARHLQSGVEAADAVVQTEGNPEPRIVELTTKYSSEGGPEELFLDCFVNTPVTAYVTLEPCCHYGRTPPCAAALSLARVKRVVVGFRDPNPRVDGGGVKFLKDCGVQVDMASGESSKDACKNLVSNFCKRITPRPELGKNYEHTTGKMRKVLRSVAARKIQEKKLPTVHWGGNSVEIDENVETAIMGLTLKPEWLEHVDSILWQHELAQLNLSKAVAKRKWVKLLGERIAQSLNAHIAQSKGHTILMYRPGIPPLINFEKIVAEDLGDSSSVF